MDHISKFRPGQEVTFDVTAAVTGGQVVQITGNRSVGPTGGVTEAWIGVAAFDAPVGGKVSVKSGGVEELIAAGAIAAGGAVVAAAAGRVADAGATPAVGTDVGVALTAAAAAGDPVLVKLTR